MKSTYQWPASRLSYDQIRRLTVISNREKRPINQLVADAVDKLLDAERRADDDSD